MDSLGYPSNTNLSAFTLAPEPNSTYLYSRSVPTFKEAPSGPTMGLMMILSTLQYQAPYMSPMYVQAASQAGKAAFIESGGQELQDKITNVATKRATQTVHSVGITDGELGFVFGTYKVYRDKQLDIAGPKIYFIKTHLTATQSSGSIGFGWDW